MDQKGSTQFADEAALAERKSISSAIEAQDKLHLYFASLIFTLLAASIQTAKFGGSAVADALELIGWVALLSAGLVLLWYLEWLYPLRTTVGNIETLRLELRALYLGKAQGKRTAFIAREDRELDIEWMINNRNEKLAEGEAHVTRQERSLIWRYAVARWSFVIAVCAIVAARAYPAITGLLAALGVLYVEPVPL
jgi:hypothetical protein